MTDIDINQTNIISIYGIQNTAIEIPSVCSSSLEINNMMSFDVQDIHKYRDYTRCFFFFFFTGMTI